MTGAPSCLPKGIAFEIADLVLVKGWADRRNLRMVVRLDYGTDCEEYEEVIAFHPESSSSCPLIMWRTAKAVFVEPLIGRRCRYGSVAKALARLASIPCTIVTDIVVPESY
jgi:hypothetical protein